MHCPFTLNSTSLIHIQVEMFWRRIIRKEIKITIVHVFLCMCMTEREPELVRGHHSPVICSHDSGRVKKKGKHACWQVYFALGCDNLELSEKCARLKHCTISVSSVLT